ncbi:MAG TPA: hypothetical protein VLT16_09805 [Candidatus Limnocylindrales bacterium]|nr:hypothetical protein [Candidatus Limnocylindrales bacterium]
MKTKALIFLVAFTVTSALAQGRWGAGPGPRYDSNHEVTISGTIEQINELVGNCGTHLVVKTDQGNMEVRLGPTKYLEDQKFELKKDEPIQVTGSKLGSASGAFVIARRISSGGKDLTLRDEKGFPAWPRGLCR